MNSLYYRAYRRPQRMPIDTLQRLILSQITMQPGLATAWFGVRQRLKRVFLHWLVPAAACGVIAYILASMPPIGLAAGFGWIVVGVLYYLGLLALRGRGHFKVPQG